MFMVFIMFMIIIIQIILIILIILIIFARKENYIDNNNHRIHNISNLYRKKKLNIF